VLLITHKLREIKAMADRCTIIRRGRWIDTVEVAAVSEGDLAEKMVGRPVSFSVAKGPFRPGEVVLAVKDLRVRCNRGLLRLKGLSLEVRAGEILGLAGVDGNGQSELVEALTGLRRVESGGVFFRGEEITNCSPREVLDRGIATIPEDRQRRGLVADFSVAENLVLERVRREPFSKRGVLDRKAIRAFAEELIRRFDVRPPAAEHPAKALSGGNQQKVIIAREVSSDPELLIAAQPTRGLDVGAIEYVHRVLAAQRDRGKAVLLVSLELEEILALADRIAVICGGCITGVLDRNETEESTLGLLMAGGRNADVRAP
ncbi:ATP-binding cassette domain-containing protein, partial [Aminiphilus sp.]|uniref:ABC transporter ATP-binding protein n=1 Tax=Aminiphilus sp. TaxID=1872488 RepID=UPI002617CA73